MKAIGINSITAVIAAGTLWLSIPFALRGQGAPDGAARLHDIIQSFASGPHLSDQAKVERIRESVPLDDDSVLRAAVEGYLATPNGFTHGDYLRVLKLIPSERVSSYLIQKSATESTPEREQNLFSLFATFPSGGAIPILVRGLDEKQNIPLRCDTCDELVHTPGFHLLRVFDAAYNSLVEILGSVHLLDESGVLPLVSKYDRKMIADASPAYMPALIGVTHQLDVRDRGVAAMKKYCDTNKDKILQKLGEASTNKEVTH